MCAGGRTTVDPLSAAAGRGPPAPGHRPRLSRHPAGFVEGPSQQHLDLGVEAAELVSGPPGESIVDRWVDEQKYLLALRAHV